MKIHKQSKWWKKSQLCDCDQIHKRIKRKREEGREQGKEIKCTHTSVCVSCVVMCDVSCQRHIVAGGKHRRPHKHSYHAFAPASPTRGLNVLFHHHCGVFVCGCQKITRSALSECQTSQKNKTKQNKTKQG